MLGVTLAAVGIELTVDHAAGAAPSHATAARVTLCAGLGLYLAGLGLMALLLRIPRRESLVMPRIWLILALVLLALAGPDDPLVALALVTAIAAVHVALNLVRTIRDARTKIDGQPRGGPFSGLVPSVGTANSDTRPNGAAPSTRSSSL